MNKQLQLQLTTTACIPATVALRFLAASLSLVALQASAGATVEGVSCEQSVAAPTEAQGYVAKLHSFHANVAEGKQDIETMIKERTKAANCGSAIDAFKLGDYWERQGRDEKANYWERQRFDRMTGEMYLRAAKLNHQEGNYRHALYLLGNEPDQEKVDAARAELAVAKQGGDPRVRSAATNALNALNALNRFNLNVSPSAIAKFRLISG